MQEMAVRGAPAIAIAGALALVVDLINKGSGMQFETAEAARDRIIEQAEYLVIRYALGPLLPMLPNIYHIDALYTTGCSYPQMHV